MRSEQRLPYGFGIWPAGDGTSRVILETMPSPARTPLNCSQRRVLRDYVEARRAARQRDRRVRRGTGAETGPD